jgi:glutaredoxin-related protein
VVTRVVDSVDTLVGGDASATIEITNVSMNSRSSALTLTVDCRLPLVDFFFFYLHLGNTADPPCPPFNSGCCRGEMGSEFLTTAVDCTANNPHQQMDAFVGAWNGQYAAPDSRELFNISIDLNRVDIPSSMENGARVIRLGLGMVVFGKLSQNTESRVELQLNSSSTATSFGQFRYSFIEYTRLQLEGCEGVVFAHLIIKATNVTGVQSLRYQTWDAGEWISPNCSSGAVMLQGVTMLSGCNVSITRDFVDVYMSMKNIKPNKTTAIYTLIQRGTVLTRVIAKTDDTVMQHCNAPVTINTTQHNAFDVEVTQGTQIKYTGPPQLIELTDVAALNLKIVSRSSVYSYAFDNVSVVYSLVDSSQVLSRMPNGKVTPELEALCDAGNVCLIETLLQDGVCQTMEKCELQGGNGLFVMPLYPWGRSTLKAGTYTVMVSEIKETVITTQHSVGNTVMRRLLNWIWDPKQRR